MNDGTGHDRPSPCGVGPGGSADGGTRSSGVGPAPAGPAPVVRRQPGGWLFWVTAAIGWLIIANGIRGVVVNRIDTRPASLTRFVVGGALVHDLVVAPLVLLAGILLARTLRGRRPLRAVVQAAAIVSALVVLFAYPLVRGYGRASGNPTSLPRNYGAGLAVIVGVVWAVALGVVALGWVRQRTARPPAVVRPPAAGRRRPR